MSNNCRSFDFPSEFRSFDFLHFLGVPIKFRFSNSLGGCSFYYGFFFPIGISSVPLETLVFLAISTSS